MNIELLKKVRERIVDEDTFFNMGYYFQPRCGTASCIAGHVCDIMGYNDNICDTHSKAKELLDLSNATADWLFYGYWNGDDNQALEELKREDAIAAIDHLLAGGSVYSEHDVNGWYEVN